jgi:hypothetical protein
MWSSVACGSPGLSWAGKTEAKTSLGGNSASASASSGAWGRESVPVRDILGYRDLSGLIEAALVLLATLSTDFGTGIWVDLGKATGLSSKESGL